MVGVDFHDVEKTRASSAFKCCWYSYSVELAGAIFFQHLSIMNILIVGDGELSKLLGDELQGGKKQEYDRLSKSSNAKDP